MSHPAVYIIILNYNSWPDTIECLESLLAQDYSNYKIIVVDNGSPNDSVPQLKAWSATAAMQYGIGFDFIHYQHGQFTAKQVREDSRISFIWSENNGGYASGNNIGIRYSYLRSKDHYLWLLNNDTIVMKDTLSILVDFFRRNASGNVGLIGCRQLFYHDPTLIQCLYGKYDKKTGLPKQLGENQKADIPVIIDQKDIHYLSGACLLTHSRVLNKVGLLNEDFFLFYEELDIAYRMRKAGYSLLFCNETSILHKHGTSIDGKSAKGSEASPFANYHHFRSKFIFAKRHHKNMMPLYLFISGIQVVNRLAKGKLRNAAAVIRGVKAGLSTKA